MPHNLKLGAAGIAGLIVGALLVWLLIPADIKIIGAPAAQQASQSPARVNEAPTETPRHEGEAAPRRVLQGIRGVARWTDGSACESVPLTAERAAANVSTQIGSGSSVPIEERRRVREALEWSRANSFHAETGPGGKFEFPGTSEGSFIVYGSDPERPLLEDTVACQGGDQIELVVKRIVLIRLDLTLETGAAVQYASVTTTGGQPYTSWRPGIEIAVDPGLVKLNVIAGEYKGEASVEVPPAGLDHPVSIVLKGEPGLIINVVRPQPYYANMSVRLYPSDTLDEGFPRHPQDLIDKGGVSESLQWASSARFPGLAPGRYTAFVVSGLLLILGRLEVDYKGGHQVEDMQLAEPSRDEFIVLRVYDPEGEPLSGAEIYIRVEGGWFAYDRPVIARGEGEYWIKRLSIRELTSSRGLVRDSMEYRISVSHDKHGRMALTCPADAREDQEARFGAKATLAVIIENMPDDPGNFEVTARPKGDFETQGRFREGMTTLQPRTEFEFASGPVTVTLSSRQPGNPYARVYFENRDVMLPASGAELRLRLPERHRLRVSVPDDVNTTYLELKMDDRALRLDLGPDRSVEFVNIPAGAYALECAVGSMPLAVPADGKITFIANPYNGLRVTHVAGELTATGLKVNDVIREVCGTKLSGTRQGIRTEAINAARDKEQVELQVQREGRTLTLTIKPEHWTHRNFFQLAIRPARIPD